MSRTKIPEQGQKIVEIVQITAELSNVFRSFEKYRVIIDKVLTPGELLTEEECQIALSKEFAQDVAKLATLSAKKSQWHHDHDGNTEVTGLIQEFKKISQAA